MCERGAMLVAADILWSMGDSLFGSAAAQMRRALIMPGRSSAEHGHPDVWARTMTRTSSGRAQPFIPIALLVTYFESAACRNAHRSSAT